MLVITISHLELSHNCSRISVLDCDNSLIVFICVWNIHRAICVWDAKTKILLEICGPGYLEALKILKNGSRVFSLSGGSIYAWSVQTGELVGEVTVESSRNFGSLAMDGPKVWACLSQSKYQGQDSGTLGSSSVQLSGIPLPNGRMLWDPRPTRIKSAATGEVIFQLPDRLTKPADVQCDGSYLVAGYGSGEILILDLRNMLL